MNIVLRGSLPGATTAGIILLTRARQLGLPIQVQVITPTEGHEPVLGPAVLYAPVLASCGVGREAGQGAMVVVPGPPRAPVLMTATPHGVDGWFYVDRTGTGYHPATQAYVRLSRDPRVAARKLSKDIRRVMELLGMQPEPAVLDVLFSADVSPLTRLSIALRAGRALSGNRGEPLTRYVTGDVEAAKDPLPHVFNAEDTARRLRDGGFLWILDGLSPALRDRAEEWFQAAADLAAEDEGRDLVLVHAIAELASHLVQLPACSILPPLGAAEDAVSVGLGAALSTDEEQDALAELQRMYRFLGGTYVDDGPHAWDVCDAPSPTEHVERWRWFCTQVRQGRKRAEELWPMMTDPPQ